MKLQDCTDTYTQAGVPILKEPEENTPVVSEVGGHREPLAQLGQLNFCSK